MKKTRLRPIWKWTLKTLGLLALVFALWQFMRLAEWRMYQVYQRQQPEIVTEQLMYCEPENIEVRHSSNGHYWTLACRIDTEKPVQDGQ